MRKVVPYIAMNLDGMIADLIDELIITIVPILLGEGILLFSRLNRKQFFDLVNIKQILI